MGGREERREEEERGRRNEEKGREDRREERRNDRKCKQSGNQILDLKYTFMPSLTTPLPSSPHSSLPHHTPPSLTTHLHSVGMPDTSSAMVITEGKVS